MSRSSWLGRISRCVFTWSTARCTAGSTPRPITPPPPASSASPVTGNSPAMWIGSRAEITPEGARVVIHTASTKMYSIVVQDLLSRRPKLDNLHCCLSEKERTSVSWRMNAKNSASWWRRRSDTFSGVKKRDISGRVWQWSRTNTKQNATSEAKRWLKRHLIPQQNRTIDVQE